MQINVGAPKIPIERDKMWDLGSPCFEHYSRIRAVELVPRSRGEELRFEWPRSGRLIHLIRLEHHKSSGREDLEGLMQFGDELLEEVGMRLIEMLPSWLPQVAESLAQFRKIIWQDAIKRAFDQKMPNLDEALGWDQANAIALL